MHRLRADILSVPLDKGGQGLVDITSKILAFRLTTLRQLLYKEVLSWRPLASCLLQQAGKLRCGPKLFLLDLQRIDISLLPSFYRSLVNAGQCLLPVLLGLSNEEFETALGITNPLHKRKLRMAIEDYRDAESGCGLSQAAELDTLWVTTVWLPELGLPQHAPAFRAQLIDGRLLRTLTRRDLEKQLHVTRRQHQQSVLCGMVLLRRVGFNKQVLIERRKQCENEDHDIIVWTNQRVVKWLRSIDLHEYADNLTSSGVHGALLVLEPSFSAESLATVLGIPTCKGYLRRHLVGELQILVGPARSKDERQTSERERKPTGCVEPFGRQFVRSNSTGKIIEEDGNVSNNEGKPSSLGQSDEKMMAEALSACEAAQYSPQRRNSLPSSTDFEVCQV
uniref:kazrin-like n=1 Tax=Myxine glutinosa TaxID=7769 RepID=UPI00358FDD88